MVSLEAWLSSPGKGGCWQKAHTAWASVASQKHQVLCELGARAWEDIVADKGSCVFNVGKF